jgi:hypothetical protein
MELFYIIKHNPNNIKKIVNTTMTLIINDKVYKINLNF